jgi:hypothetical protein
MTEPMRRSVLGAPRARVMTVMFCVAISASLRAQRSNPSIPDPKRGLASLRWQ